MARTSGILFFIDFAQPCALLTVALHSLGQHYDGEIAVMCGQHVPSWYRAELGTNRRITVHEVDPSYSQAKSQWHCCIRLKPWMHANSPFDVTMFYDCDHVFIRDFDATAFDMIESVGLMTFHSKPVIQSFERCRRKANLIREYIDRRFEAEMITSANGGCVGSVRGHAALQEWSASLALFAASAVKCFRFVPDEYSLSYVCQQCGIPNGPRRWSHTVKGLTRDAPVPDDTIAIHFAQGCYAGADRWANAIQSAVDDNYMHMGDRRDEYMSLDYRLAKAVA